MDRTAPLTKTEILSLIAQYCQFAQNSAGLPPDRGKTMDYAGFSLEERMALIENMLDFSAAAGDRIQLLEEKLRTYFNAEDVVLVSSGAQATSLCLTSILAAYTPKGLLPGDEVIVPAVTQPSTYAAILQLGLIPVVVDCKPGTCNLDDSRLEAAVGEKTRALLLPHALGYPNRMDLVMDVVARYRLWLIEDGCEAFGAKFGGRLAGTFGELAAINLGKRPVGNGGSAGAVVVNDPALADTVRCLRDSGREPLQKGEAGLKDHDDIGHIYIKRSLFWRPAEIQAVAGLAHLRQAEQRLKDRQRLAEILRQGILSCKDTLLPPSWPEKSEPSFAGCPLFLLKGRRAQLFKLLRNTMFKPGLIAAGNILRQPAFKNMPYRAGSPDFKGADRITDQGFLLPLHGQISDATAAQLTEKLKIFCRDSTGS
ncbi:MAG: DegT/DnrJ/EryC1/StrS family aminotransferase [Syntrophomonadaceae bacterium]|nr:DegT/DnrJ/EryC1/StrS family aminotransferase [Syntrophomonadaceae bacterium]